MDVLLFVVSVVVCVLFFFFKQKTAYEMRISDWSSDVCSSDRPIFAADGQPFAAIFMRPGEMGGAFLIIVERGENRPRIGQREQVARHVAEIGSASCRERVCQYV